MLANTLQNNDRASFIRKNLSKGKSREEIAALLGYKTWRSLDIYMRRSGAKWDSRSNTYRQQESTENDQGDLERIIDEAEPKIAAVIKKLAAKNADPLQVAKECGFSDHRALSTYMKAKGYHWSVDINNYIDAPLGMLQSGTTENEKTEQAFEAISINTEKFNIEKYIPILEMIYKNKEKLLDFVTPLSAAGTIPRYTVPGITRTKSFYMSDKLSRLITEFSEAKNISQKEIIEAAVIEFLRKHSFKNEVDSLLGR